MSGLTRRQEADAFDFVADWHDRQARQFHQMAHDEPRIDPAGRQKAAEAARHHAGSAGALRLMAIETRRAALEEARK